MNFAPLEVMAQCEEAYSLCTKQLSKEDKKAGWNVNKQSLGVSFEKGEVYEMDISAYSGLEYRLSVCSDIAGGTEAKFQLEQEVMVTVEDSLGNVTIERQRKVIFDNTTGENEELYVLFRSNKKNEKFYLSVNVPSEGKSKKLGNTESVCVGVLLEHRRTKKSAF